MKKRILIVDDDPAIRDSMKKVLDDAGYSSALASDGEEAVTGLREQQFDLLILDIELPKISGWDVLDLVSASQPLLPVIVLTAFRQQCEPGALCRADVLLEKPPDVPLLLQTIDALLQETPEARLRRTSPPLSIIHPAGCLRLLGSASQKSHDDLKSPTPVNP